MELFTYLKALCGHYHWTLLTDFTLCRPNSIVKYDYAIVDIEKKDIFFLVDVANDNPESKAKILSSKYGYAVADNEGRLLLYDIHGQRIERNIDYQIRYIEGIRKDSESFPWYNEENNTWEYPFWNNNQEEILQYFFGNSTEIKEDVAERVNRNKNKEKLPLCLSKNHPENKSLLYRYMTLEGLYRLLQEGELIYSLCSVCSMNDRWEYAYGTDNGSRILFIGNAPETFILSLSEVNPMESLDMWRLYGDNTKGVCLVFEITDEGYLNRVKYLKDFNGVRPGKYYLDGHSFEVKNVDTKCFSIKSDQYKIEKEVRWIIHHPLNKGLNENMVEKDDDLKPNVNSTGRCNNVGSNRGKIKWVKNKDGVIFPIISISKNKPSHKIPFELKQIILGASVKDAELSKSLLAQLTSACGLIGVEITQAKDMGYKP